MFKTTAIDTLKQDKKCQACWYMILSTMSGSTTIIQGSAHFAMQGDNSFLDEKLVYLRNIDAINQLPVNIMCLGRIYYHMSRLISGRQAQRVAPLTYVTTAMHDAAIGFTTRS